MTKTLNIIGEKVSNYFYGTAFPIQIGLLVVLCYIIKLPLIALSLIVLSATLIFLCCKNLAPIFPLLFMVLLAFNSYEPFNELTAYLIILPAGIALVARFFIHPVKWQRPSLLLYALLAVTLAFALGGLTSNDYNPKLAIAYLISLGPVMIIIYLLFSNNIIKIKDFDVKKYLCLTILIAGLAISAEIAYLRYVAKQERWIELGWANVNACAGFLLLAIPACYYLTVKSKATAPLIICLLCLYFGMLISGSDAAFCIAIAYSPFLLLYTFTHVYGIKRKILGYSAFIIILGVAVAILIYASKYSFNELLGLLQLDSNDSGRNEIYMKAIELFRKNPIFGAGFSYTDEWTQISPVRLYNFHSTFFHTLATMGIFGVVAYGFYVFIRFFILMKKNTSFTTIMLIAFIMFESYAMVDTGEFNAIPLMCTVTVIITVAEWSTKKENMSCELPLATYNYIKR